MAVRDGKEVAAGPAGVPIAPGLTLIAESMPALPHTAAAVAAVLPAVERTAADPPAKATDERGAAAQPLPAAAGVAVPSPDGSPDAGEERAAEDAGQGRRRGRPVAWHRLDPRLLTGATGIAVAAFLLVAIAEILVAYGDPRVGLGMHIALLGLTLALAAQTADDRRRAFFMALAIAPIIRIASTGMPLPSFSQPWWYVLTSVPLFIAGFVIAREAGLRRAEIGVRLPDMRRLPVDLAVGLSGVGLGCVEYAILRPGPMVDSHSVTWLVGGALILLICTGLVEEFLFRGILQYVAVRQLGVRGGIAFTAGLFAALHIGHLSVLDDFFVLGVGLYFSAVVLYTRSLLGVTLAHGLINVMLFIVLPLGLLSQSTSVPAAPASTAAPKLAIQNYPRTVVGGRMAACSPAGNTGRARQPGCESVSSISLPGATVMYTLTYSNGSTQTFTDKADARGHSLHPFNVTYVPPRGSRHGQQATVARIAVTVRLKDGTLLRPATTRFAVIR